MGVISTAYREQRGCRSEKHVDDLLDGGKVVRTVDYMTSENMPSTSVSTDNQTDDAPVAPAKTSGEWREINGSRVWYVKILPSS